MSESKTFCQEKFKNQLLAASVTMAVVFLMALSDMLIAGNMVGESAIVGINLVTPLLTLIAFVSMMIGTGTAYRFSYEMGGFHKDKAARFIGQGFILALGASVVMFVAVFFGQEAYCRFVQTSEDVMAYVRGYYTWFPYVAATYPLFVLMQDLVYADGGTKICTYANMTQVFGNIGISIVGCRVFGVSGISLGTFAGNVLSILILSIRFFSRDSSLRAKLHFSGEDVLTVLKYSYIHASLYLYAGLSSAAINKAFLMSFGETYFPVLTVVYGVLEMTMVFDGVGQAMEPITNIYWGEGNTDGVRKISRYALRVAVTEGVVATLILLCAGGKLAALFHITTPELVRMADAAVRIYAPAMLFIAPLCLLGTHYLLIDHILLSVLMSASRSLILPVVFCVTFSHAFGIHGVWAGMLCAPIVTALAFGAFLFVRYRDSFPFLLPRKDIVSADVTLTQEEVMKLRDWAEAECDRRGVNLKRKTEVMLLMEEGGMRVLEANPQKPPLMEATLFFEDGVKLILRDNGSRFNMTDEDENLNFRAMFFSDLIRGRTSFGYLITGNYNRNVFRVDPQRETVDKTGRGENA